MGDSGGTMENVQGKVGRQAALVYTLLSLGAALLFVIIATAVGGYTDIARFGGGVWVFMLSMIVSMPLITARFKQRPAR